MKDVRTYTVEIGVTRDVNFIQEIEEVLYDLDYVDLVKIVAVKKEV